MIIGLPKEIKDNEYRVGLTPAGVRALTDAGHRVLVETTAGAGSGFDDSLYQTAGAAIAAAADDVWGDAEMVVKVKEPIAPEYPRMREGQLLFTYLHLAPDNELTEHLLRRKVTGVAYDSCDSFTASLGRTCRQSSFPVAGSSASRYDSPGCPSLA